MKRSKDGAWSISEKYWGRSRSWESVDTGEQVDLESMAEKVKAANLSTHLLERVRDFAKRLRMGELDKVWVGMTASRLSHVQNREISRFLGRLADLLRM